MLNEKKFREIYDDFLDSGLTIRDYCINQQLTESKFFYWQKKLSGLLPPKSGFVPIVFNKEHQVQLPVPVPVQNRPEVFSKPDEKNKPISFEISYPNGVNLKLNGGADFEILRSLILLTRQ